MWLKKTIVILLKILPRDRPISLGSLSRRPVYGLTPTYLRCDSTTNKTIKSGWVYKTFRRKIVSTLIRARRLKFFITDGYSPTRNTNKTRNKQYLVIVLTYTTFARTALLYISLNHRQFSMIYLRIYRRLSSFSLTQQEGEWRGTHERLRYSYLVKIRFLLAFNWIRRLSQTFVRYYLRPRYLTTGLFLGVFEPSMSFLFSKYLYEFENDIFHLLSLPIGYKSTNYVVCRILIFNTAYLC